ncbi:MAG: hypothetical protein WAO98_03370 [Alphaproteobacteria bacterium]
MTIAKGAAIPESFVNGCKRRLLKVKKLIIYGTEYGLQKLDFGQTLDLTHATILGVF